MLLDSYQHQLEIIIYLSGLALVGTEFGGAIFAAEIAYFIYTNLGGLIASSISHYSISSNDENQIVYIKEEYLRLKMA